MIRSLISRTSKQTISLDPEQLTKARKYIDDYWSQLIKYNPKDNATLIGLPHPYLVPSSSPGREFDFNEMFYWDSYFMVQGLYKQTKYDDLVHGILDNLIYLFNKVGIIPNSNQYYMTSRSQPPFLSTFIREVYSNYKHDLDWLKSRMPVAEAEYNNVWLSKIKPNVHQVFAGLSRYYDVNYLNDIAEAESGWDMTPRFNRKALNYLPIDLNCLLFKYEQDFVWYYNLINQPEIADKYRQLSANRASTIDKYMWSKYKNLYFDYDYINQKKSVVASLASFYPLYVKMVNEERAAELVKSLKNFIYKGGLATTDSLNMAQVINNRLPTQWAYPNGWAPLQFVVIKGLENYGYHSLARDIALRWLNCNLKWFINNGLFLEKYNVVNISKPPLRGLYPAQEGFGWTNSVFEALVQDYLEN